MKEGLRMNTKKKKNNSLVELLKFAGNSKKNIKTSILLAVIGVLLGMFSYLGVAMVTTDR
jgi:hypothetical protein